MPNESEHPESQPAPSARRADRQPAPAGCEYQKQPAECLFLQGLSDWLSLRFLFHQRNFKSGVNNYSALRFANSNKKSPSNSKESEGLHPASLPVEKSTAVICYRRFSAIHDQAGLLAFRSSYWLRLPARIFSCSDILQRSSLITEAGPLPVFTGFPIIQRKLHLMPHSLKKWRWCQEIILVLPDFAVLPLGEMFVMR